MESLQKSLRHCEPSSCKNDEQAGGLKVEVEAVGEGIGFVSSCDGVGRLAYSGARARAKLVKKPLSFPDGCVFSSDVEGVGPKGKNLNGAMSKGYPVCLVEREKPLTRMTRSEIFSALTRAS